MNRPGPTRIVLTGGPGAGKTTVIEALAAAGRRTSPEVGRRIIRDEVAKGGEALPWADRAGFAEKMLDAEIEAYDAVRADDGPIFFDRGLPDVLGYVRLCGLPERERLHRAIEERPYAPLVFMAPFWPEIFAQDDERKQSPEEARRTTAMMASTYSELGYELVALPFAAPEERAAFMLDRIAGLRTAG